MSSFVALGPWLDFQEDLVKLRNFVFGLLLETMFSEHAWLESFFDAHFALISCFTSPKVVFGSRKAGVSP